MPSILRHLACSLLLATIVPSVLFYVCLVVGDVWLALAGALTWCYGVMAWRLATHRRCSALLWLTAVGLTAKTVLSVATASTFVYFAQPAVTDAVIAVIFFGSLVGAKPVVARLAADFYPMTDEVAKRPRVQRLFRHLTLMWALLCLGQAVVTIWLLESSSLTTFVAARTILTTGVAVIGAAATVALAVRIARTESLLANRLQPAG